MTFSAPHHTTRHAPSEGSVIIGLEQQGKIDHYVIMPLKSGSVMNLYRKKNVCLRRGEKNNFDTVVVDGNIAAEQIYICSVNWKQA